MALDRSHQLSRWLAVAVTIAAAGLAACGDENGSEVRTVTVSAGEPSTSPADPVTGDAILIETRVSDARHHKTRVLGASFIGKSAFCPGGKATGGSDGPTIFATFRCPDGRLKIRFAPAQPSLVQSAIWEVVSGTGSFKGLRGGGSMVARFPSGDPERGRETFTGTVTE